MSIVDVPVDGRFVEDRRSLALQFRGSDNQRLIDVGASLAESPLARSPLAGSPLGKNTVVEYVP
ncbi:MAG: radical SAM protein [Lachnospiraceae bacterium]|nr:radical SAM protein [Ruminococcus sp.]MCM1274531.1 radical SAM protein [Lachnospiraceae bacterium]